MHEIIIPLIQEMEREKEEKQKQLQIQLPLPEFLEPILEEPEEKGNGVIIIKM